MGKKLIKKNYLPRLHQSDYEFNRFSKDVLDEDISVNQLYSIGSPYSHWVGFSECFYDQLKADFIDKDSSLSCFFVFPYWMDDKVRYRKLGPSRLLKKEYGIDSIEFEQINSISESSKLIFSGVINVDRNNSCKVFDLLSTFESGVLFSGGLIEGAGDKKLMDSLDSLINYCAKTTTFRLNIPCSVQKIVSSGRIAIIPSAWEETGEYGLDVFSKADQ